MIIRAFPNNMSTNKEGKKPQYKDYVHFLDAYKNGKKDESTGYSLNNSSNNSSSSINSDYLSEQTSKGFKEYLENYENKRFNSVKPTFLKKNIEYEKKTVKTEIFINITSDQKSVNNTHLNCNGVEKFEKNSNSETITKTVSSKVNKYNSQQSETENDGSAQKKISVEEISKKFQTNDNNTYNTLETKKATLKKQDSIKEKSRIFENNVNEIIDKIHSTNSNVMKQNSFKEHSKIFKEKESLVTVKPKISLPPKPPTIKVDESQNVTTGENIIESKRLASPSSPSKNNDSTIIQEIVSCPNAISHSSSASPVVKVSPLNCTTSPNKIPAPPPLPQGNIKVGSSIGSLVSPIFPSSANSLPTVKTNHTHGFISTPVPPPPPLPCNITTKATSTSNCTSNTGNKNNHVSGYNTLPRMQYKSKDAADGISAPTVDKNDPRVKKLVYNALRDMYGAYHNQANDYIATLPKNRVRRNNGLDSIINSIA